jgi:hypothetical protein
MQKKARRVLWYPTQAKTGLEWGTQPLPPKWTVRDSGSQSRTMPWVRYSTDLSKLLVEAPAFMRGEERFSAP